MSLPKMASVLKRERAEKLAEAAEASLFFSIFLALMHVVAGCFVQLAILFAAGGLYPSLCFELLGVLSSIGVHVVGAKVANRLPQEALYQRALSVRVIPILIWYLTVGVCICYALWSEQWFLALWISLLLVTVWMSLDAELKLRFANQTIAEAKREYEHELQELMDRLTC